MSSLSVSATVSPLHTPRPDGLVITPRDRRFGRDSAQRRWWMNGDPVATAFMTALSVTFPRGEAMFIESVKHFRDQAPESLQPDIRAFVLQEVMHTREHVAFNRKAEETGYDLAPLYDDVNELMDMAAQRPPMVNLLATVALEHYTAILAADLLRNPDMFAGADQEWADMWRWHAIEEIEHKGVAYDTMLHATKGWTRWRRWKAKSLTMLLVSINFWPRRIKGMRILLAQDGITGWQATRRIWWYLLGKPGVLRRLVPAWLSFFLPRFHPWNHDDRALINAVDSAYAAARPDPVVVANEPVEAAA